MSLRDRVADANVDLFDESEVEILASEQILKIPKHSLYSVKQVRKDFNVEALDELAKSIEEDGQYQPCVVWPQDSKGYRIHIGERRWRAIMSNPALTHVDVVIRDKNTLVQQLSENIHREDLTPLEVCEAIKAVKEQYGLTRSKDVAAKLKMSPAKVSMYEKVDTAPEEILEAYSSGKLGDADSINALRIAYEINPNSVREILQNDSVSRKDAKELTKKLKDKKKPKSDKSTVKPKTTNILVQVGERQGLLVGEGKQKDGFLTLVLDGDNEISTVHVDDILLIGYL